MGHIINVLYQVTLERHTDEMAALDRADEELRTRIVRMQAG